MTSFCTALSPASFSTNSTFPGRSAHLSTLLAYTTFAGRLCHAPSWRHHFRPLLATRSDANMLVITLMIAGVSTFLIGLDSDLRARKSASRRTRPLLLLLRIAQGIGSW